jgi:hypothetical protein
LGKITKGHLDKKKKMFAIDSKYKKEAIGKFQEK